MEKEFYERNLKRDVQDCVYEMERVFEKDTSLDVVKIKGNIFYMNAFHGSYQYDASFFNDEIILSTKIFFRNVTKKILKHNQNDYLAAAKKIQWAQDYWNSHVPEDLNIRFEFKLVQEKEHAYFSPALVRKKTRGPYYAGWSVYWPNIVIAHEIGHMFGLDDEYENGIVGPNTDFCLQDSLMCAHRSDSHLKAFHFKIILDRLNCMVND